ncbi:MAG: hypothetical protein NZL96_03865 [Patescibacteria group bacterium]|nr:hypothetical protein [Patescibacteria group bacterium]
MKKVAEKIRKFLLEKYFLLVVLGCLAFVGLVSIYQIFFSKPEYIYVKVKVGQGLWWATTQRPSIWFVEAFKRVMKEEEKEITGKPMAKILSIRYYPFWDSNQYDVYLIMKLRVSKLRNSGKYNFRRSVIGVGSPIEFEFPSLKFSGTIIEISEKPINDKLIEKEIILTKKNAGPFEYDSITVGDFYHDGKEKVFEVIGKSNQETQTLTEDIFGNYPVPDKRVYIFIKAKIKVKPLKNDFIFGEEQIIKEGKFINLITEKFNFRDFQIAKVI